MCKVGSVLFGQLIVAVVLILGRSLPRMNGKLMPGKRGPGGDFGHQKIYVELE